MRPDSDPDPMGFGEFANAVLLVVLILAGLLGGLYLILFNFARLS